MSSTWLSPAVLWFFAGVVLLIAEFTIGGFLAVFFAAGAWVAALLLWIGVIDGVGPAIIVFLAVSVLSLAILRRRLQPIVRGSTKNAEDTDRALEDIVGKRATVVESIVPALNTGKVDFHGAAWAAKSDSRIETGAVVEIVGRDNITLKVKPAEE